MGAGWCSCSTTSEGLHPELGLTVAPFGVSQLDVTAGAGGVLPGALGGEQVLDLAVQGFDGGVHLVVLGPQDGLVGSVLVVAGVISAAGGARGSGKTGSSGLTLRFHGHKNGSASGEWIDAPALITDTCHR